MTETARFERRTRTSDGVDLVWFDHGSPDGEPLMIVHGMGAGSDQFDADARFFAGKGMRVIVPDLRGHGRSGKSPDTNYAITRMAQDLIEILDDAGCGAVDYVGNSLGGILALHLLADHKDRFRTLAMFGTAPALRLPSVTPTLLPLTYRVMGKRAVGWLTARMTTPTSEGRAIIGPLVRDFDPKVARAVGDAVRNYDLTANALAFEKPFLILRGDRDMAVNRALDPRLSALGKKANVRIVRMDGAGHCANLDQPEVFRKAVLEFLAQGTVRQD